MSDTGKRIEDPLKHGFPKVVRDITKEDIELFFEQIDKEIACPICSSELEVMAAVGEQKNDDHEFLPNPAIAGVVVHEAPESRLEYKTPAFVMQCIKCGFLNYFSVSHIVAWKHENDNGQ